MTEKELLELKTQVDKAKTVVSELTGQRNALMKQFKDDWSCDTIEEADKKLKEIEYSVSNFDSKIASGIKELEEKLQK